MKAAEELAQLVAKGDTMGNLCQLGCDIMEWGSHIVGLTYYQFNILLFYVIEPILLFLTLSLIYWKLIRKNDGKPNRIIWSGILLICIAIFLYYLIPVITHANWNELGADKVNELQRLGEFSGTNYAIVNLFLFVAFFLIVFFGNLIYLSLCNKKSWIRGISYIYWLPLVCFLLIGWGGHF